ncbi:MAG: enterotoxin [Xanthomonadales bacterium]|nr:enterotoxin [Xanthomonadales bacterium]
MVGIEAGAKASRRLAGIVLACAALVGTMLPSGVRAGDTDFIHDGSHYRFGNAAVTASWEVAGNHLSDLSIHDGINQHDIPVPVPFELVTDGGTLGIDDMQLLAPPQLVHEQAEPGASRLAARLPGSRVQARFMDADGRIRVDWQLVQPDGSQYLREIVTLTALKGDEAISQVALLGVEADGANVDGTVDGSPVVWHSDWFGFEYPMSHAEVRGGHVRMWVERVLPLRKGTSVTYSAVVGAAAEGQLRRGFATYIERERAHPYRPFLHYNTYYDLDNYSEAQVLDRINAFGHELVQKRHVRLDSFLLDGGWEDPGPDWNFGKGFPHGFAPVCQAAVKYGAAPGVWMSPWGGYGKGKLERIALARQEGYEIINGGLALSGPKYWQRFHQVAMTLLKDDCINQFKFDGTGNVDSVVPGSQFDSDFAAMIQLIDDIRAAKPDIFINVSTGTWASPFWLRWTDTVWRGSVFDHNFAGVGTPRERWITFRDQVTYQNIVVAGPLFPINSLMLHGIIYAQHAVSGARLPDFPGLRTDPGHDFANEVHSFFATGTQLQELYITPSLLSGADWDALAAAARWSRDNAKVLQDVHWIGGDPGRLQVYGWAAWTPAKAIVTLRNPDEKPQTAVVDLQRQLELPVGAPRVFGVHDVWRTGGDDVPSRLDADWVATIRLAPFEVLTLVLTPKAATGMN